jgi:hypothetical protein
MCLNAHEVFITIRVELLAQIITALTTLREEYLWARAHYVNQVSLAVDLNESFLKTLTLDDGL